MCDGRLDGNLLGKEPDSGHRRLTVKQYTPSQPSLCQEGLAALGGLQAPDSVTLSL